MRARSTYLLGAIVALSIFIGWDLANADDTLRVMTYNVRYASSRPPNAWRSRRPVARAMLQQYQPDVVGMQEAVYQQVKDFQTDLPDYSWIGLGRDGGSRGEFMAVFYRRERLEPLEFDHFWLSDTPDVIGSTTWGNSNRRMVTWVKFQDKQTKRVFLLWNTHFDHRIQKARENSAKLILQRIPEATDTPLLLLGDFNAVAGENPVFNMLVKDGPFQDTWDTAESTGPAVSTFHGYRGIVSGGRRIDWILSRGKVRVTKSTIVTFSQNDQFPSDHCPVVAEVILGQPPADTR